MQKISPAFIRSLLNNKAKEIVHFNEGTILAREGEKITHLYFLLYGKLGQNKTDREVITLEESF